MAYYVYLLASKKHGTLYLGVTNDLIRRDYEHRTKAAPGFTSRYDIGKLVWFEIYDNAITAIARERAEEVAARLENQADRGEQPELGRSVSGDLWVRRCLTLIVGSMDSGLAPSAQMALPFACRRAPE